MRHNPDCDFWYDYWDQDCTCGLSRPRPEGSDLEPWTEARWKEWAAGIVMPEPC